IGLLRREEFVPLADLRELGRREWVHRFERDQAAAKALEGGDGPGPLLFIGLRLDRDARGVRERLVLGKTELGADLFLEKAQRARRALLFDRELSALAADLRKTLASPCETLLRFAARAFRSEGPFAR